MVVFTERYKLLRNIRFPQVIDAKLQHIAHWDKAFIQIWQVCPLINSKSIPLLPYLMHMFNIKSEFYYSLFWLLTSLKLTQVAEEDWVWSHLHHYCFLQFWKKYIICIYGMYGVMFFFQIKNWHVSTSNLQ